MKTSNLTRLPCLIPDHAIRNDEQNGTGAGFLLVLQFSGPFIIPLIA
jgi:hypothetical protein